MVAVDATLLEQWNSILPAGVVAPAFSPPQISIAVLAGGEFPFGTKKNAIQTRHPIKRNAIELQEFGERFWRGHWHIFPREDISLGNLLTDQIREFALHNAHRIPQTINSITETGVDGVILSDNGSPPIVQPAQTTLSYTLTIEAAGAGTLDYNVVFNFTVGSLDLGVSARRVVIFPFEPEKGMIERWTWGTNIIENANGSEQRVSVRDIPAQEWIFSVLSGNEEHNARLENLLYGVIPNEFAFPIFIDENALSASVGVGATVLTLTKSTVDTNFVAGGSAIIITDQSTAEVVVVESVGANSLTLPSDAATAFAWAAGAIVMPVHLVKAKSPAITLHRVNARQFDIEVRNLNPIDYSSEAGFTTYKGNPIWTDPWLIDETYERNMFHNVNRKEGPGLFFDSKIQEYPKVESSMVFNYRNRADFWRIKRWVHARRGQQKVFWMSSRRPDFFLESDATDADTINIVPLNYVEQVFSSAANVRRDIEITYTNGAIDRREIVAGSVIEGVREILTPDTSLSQFATFANVEQISYMYLFRFNSDSIDLVQEAPNIGTASTVLMEVVA